MKGGEKMDIMMNLTQQVSLAKKQSLPSTDKALNGNKFEQVYSNLSKLKDKGQASELQVPDKLQEKANTEVKANDSDKQVLRDSGEKSKTKTDVKAAEEQETEKPEKEVLNSLIVAVEQLVKILDKPEMTLENQNHEVGSLELDKALENRMKLDNLVNRLGELLNSAPNLNESMDADAFALELEKTLAELEKVDLGENSLKQVTREMTDSIKQKLEGMKFTIVEAPSNNIASTLYLQMKSARPMKEELPNIEADSKFSEISLEAADENVKVVLTTDEAMASGDSEESLMGQEKSSEKNTSDKSAKPALAFALDSKVEVATLNKADTGSVVKNSDTQQIIDQIQKNMKNIRLANGTQEIKMILKPEQLGEVNLKLALDKGGLTAKFVVQSEAVKEAIDKNLQTLKETLQAQGVEVKEIKIVVKTPENQDLNFENSEKHKGNQQNPQKQKEDKADTEFESFMEFSNFEVNA